MSAAGRRQGLVSCRRARRDPQDGLAIDLNFLAESRDRRRMLEGVQDIGAAVGFVDRRTFERAFRRRYGMTPGSWRREHRHAGSAPATLNEEMPPA